MKLRRGEEKDDWRGGDGVMVVWVGRAEEEEKMKEGEDTRGDSGTGGREVF